MPYINSFKTTLNKVLYYKSNINNTISNIPYYKVI